MIDLSQASEGPPGLMVVGCPRSGTSLLATILEARFDFAVPFETHFIPFFGYWARLWGDLKDVQNRRALLEGIYQFLELGTPRMMGDRRPADVKAHSLLITRPHIEDIAGASRNYGDLIRNLFRTFAAMNGKSRWADKSAFSHPVPMAAIADHLPGLRIIHIVRDGRDVVLSWMRSWVAPANLETAARLWAAHVRSKRDWGDQHPERYLEIRFEELILNAEAQISRIAAFLGVKPDSAGARVSRLAEVMGQSKTHTKITGELDATSVGQWRTGLTAREVEVVEIIAGRELALLGYDCEVRPRARLLRSLVSNTGSLLSPFEYIRWSRPIVPPAIRLTQALGLSLPRLLNTGPRMREWNEA